MSKTFDKAIKIIDQDEVSKSEVKEALDGINHAHRICRDMGLNRLANDLFKSFNTLSHIYKRMK